MGFQDSKRYELFLLAVITNIPTPNISSKVLVEDQFD